MSTTRRDFLKFVAAGSAAAAARPALADDAKTDFDAEQTFGVLVDATLCLGCRKCEWACNQVNHLSDNPCSQFEDESVFQHHRRPRSDAFTVVNSFHVPDEPERRYTLKVQCMHCIEPACVSACIVGALQKDPRGPVTYDASKCIGCRYCLIACPFQIPAYEYEEPLTPRVRKCTFCFERVTEHGEVPACVAVCPNEALRFGKRGELIEAAYTRMADTPERYYPHLYGEQEVGGTSWMYLAPADFSHTELPDLETDPIPRLTESIQHGLFKSFVPPLLLYGLLGLIMHSLQGNKEREDTDNDQ
jgi:formate dehydrogenase iron-sulfur subunit